MKDRIIQIILGIMGKHINPIVRDKKILLLLILNFFTLQGQTFISHDSGIFLSLDWRTGFFHLYDHILTPWAFSGTYSRVNDTIFCDPRLMVLDTSAFKYDYMMYDDTVRQFVFVKEDGMLKSITAKWNGYNYNHEWFDSLYFVSDHDKWLWQEVYK